MATRLPATLLIFAGLLTSASAAEPDLSNYLPVCDSKFGLCRYIDKKTKQELIPPRFERAMPFSEGLAAVRINGQFGYIDQRGEIVIPPRFDLAGEFHHGLAEILVSRNTGVIDRTGRAVVLPQFRRAIPLTKDVIVATPGAWQSGYFQGFEKLDDARFANLQGAGLYHVSGRWIMRPGPDVQRISMFDSEGRGLVWVTTRGDKSDLVGLMAADGSWVVEPQFSYGAALTDGRAIVRKQIDGVTHSGALDESGKLVVPFKPWLLFYWLNGQAIAQEKPGSGQKQALVDKNGDIIGGRWFDKVERAETGDIAIVWIDGRAMGLDRAGNLIEKLPNGRVTARCPSGISVVEIDGRFQITDTNGQTRLPPLFTTGRLECQQPTPVQRDGKWGYIGVDGKLLFDPPLFDSEHGFSDGTAVVQQNGKWGIIDTSGRFTVEAKYDSFGASRGGLFRVGLNGRDFWIDASGNEKPEPPPPGVRPEPRLLDCGQGVKLFNRNGLWGIADGDKEIIAPKYRAMICFHNGIAWAPIDTRRQWCPLGPDGAERDQPACMVANYPLYLTHSYPEKFHDDPFENSVLWTRAYFDFAAGKRDQPPRWINERMR